MEGCLIERPGWIRMSIHPTMTNDEIEFICDAIAEVSNNFSSWSDDYEYNALKNEYIHKGSHSIEKEIIQDWFD